MKCPKCGDEKDHVLTSDLFVYYCAKCSLAWTEWQQEEIERLRAEIKAMEASFDLRWKADRRAIERWQKQTGEGMSEFGIKRLCESCGASWIDIGVDPNEPIFKKCPNCGANTELKNKSEVERLRTLLDAIAALKGEKL